MAEAFIEASTTITEDVYTFPVSFSQMDMWLAARLAGESAAYQIAQGLLLEGPLHIQALARSLNGIVARHETLRTTFSEVEGDVLQVVVAEKNYELPVIDIQSLSPDERERRLESMKQSVACTPFNLEKGPLVRWELARLGPEKHILFLTMHHLITDAWSESIFLRELAAFYEAFAQGQDLALPELAIQYGDFAVWERESRTAEQVGSMLDYWKNELKQNADTLPLPVDARPDTPMKFKCAFEPVAIPAAATDAIKEIGAREGATLFVTLTAALAVLLYRLSGRDNLLIGAPMVNRDRVELEGIIGMFLSSLLLHMDLSGNPTFLELLPRVREAVYGAQEHHGVPLENLASLLHKEQRPRGPLVRVLFNLESTPQAGVLEPAGLKIKPFQIGTDFAKADFIWNTCETPSGLEGSFEYNTDLFAQATIQRMVERLATLIKDIAQRPAVPIDALNVLPDSEAKELLAHEDYASPRDFVHELVATQAAMFPDAIAVIDQNRTFTFAQLNQRANRLAHCLIARGAGPETPVAVPTECSLDFVIAVLGVLKAGACFVPIDSAAPAERIRSLLKDTGIRTVLTGFGWKTPLPEGAESVLLDGVVSNASIESDQAPAVRLDPDNLAYVIYTSGSSGRPKGVMVSHGTLANYLSWCQSNYFAEREHGALLHGSLAADMSITSLFTPLLAGQPITTVGEADYVETLAASLHSQNAYSFIKLTPSHLQMLNTMLSSSDRLGCRRLIVGGEALLFEQLSKFRASTPEMRIINEYGPTETVVGCCVYEMNADDPDTGPVSIGRPLPGITVYVLDASGRPVPIGVRGELYVGGKQVTRGYWQQPSITAERFVPDPFGSEPGARLYRTGDLVRMRCDLMLEYFGRVDDQLKVKGFRIEPGEVEETLLQHPSIAQAAVVGSKEETGTVRLMAYVVQKQSVPAAELRQFLAGRLPEAMVPSSIFVVSELPLTRSGKVDRKALAALKLEVNTTESNSVAPRNTVEEILVSIWETVLEVDGVGIHDNFYSLGGDSMRSLRVAAMAKARGIPLSIRLIAQNPTVAALSTLLRSTETEAEQDLHTEPFGLISAEDRAKLPGDIVDAYPLAHMQLGMLFHNEMTPNAPLFHSINSYHLRLPFDEEKIKSAVLHMTARHPNLRTSFDLSSYSQPLQLVHSEPCFPIGMYDLRHLDPAEQERELQAFWEKESRRPFDLSRPPQLRIHLHRRTDDSFQYTLTENHAVIDGWSLHVVLDEILQAYFALLDANQLPAFPPLKTTFRDFIAAETRVTQSRAAAEYWENKLRDYTPGKLPRVPKHRVDPSQLRVRRMDHILPNDLVRRLRKIAREQSVPLKSVLFAAHVKVISSLYGRNDVVTGLSCNGRLETEDGERVCGLFLNTLPMRIRLSSGTWAELVRQVSHAELEFISIRRYPISLIQSHWGTEPLFDTSCVYLNFHVIGEQVRSGNLECIEAGAFVEETNFAIMTAFQHLLGKSSRIVLSLCVDSWVFTDEQIENINQYYLRTLQALAGNSSGSHEAFSPLSETEQRELVAMGAGQRSAASKLVLDLFRDHVGRTPGHPAVQSAETRISYAELDRRSNQLARYLLELGVGSESRVAIVMDHCPEQVTALLAVLKSGAGYVPISPKNVKTRIGFMLHDAGVSAILTLAEWRGCLDDRSVRIVCLDSDIAAISGNPDFAPAVEIQPEQLAYLIYTSGTTGNPKGVAIEHRQLENYTLATIERLQCGEHRRFGLISTFAADLGNTMIFPALCSGGCLVVFSERQAMDAAALAEQLVASPIDYLKIVPSHLQALVAHSEDHSILPHKGLVLGGESAHRHLIEKVRKLSPGCIIFNHYGPTETTVGVLAGTIESSWGGATNPLLGQPLDNVEVYVLDENMKLAPVGTAGELYIGGKGVGRGYWGNRAATAEKFIPDAFGPDPGGRLYRTGDLVRRLAEGQMEFLGRIDRQVKVRGYRIELQEIEFIVEQNPQIATALAMLESTGDEPRLVVYAVVAGKEPIDEKELLGFLRTRLPQAAVPDEILLLPAFPVTANGKVDTRAFRQLSATKKEAHETTDHGRGPETTMEMELAQLWLDVLKVERIGVHDDFFELGGNSIKAILLAARLRKALKISVSVIHIFETRTIARMAQALADLRRSSIAEKRITPHDPEKGACLSFAQKRFWYAYQLDRGSFAQNIPVALRLRGRLDVFCLQASLNEILSRHVILRSYFPSDDGEPRVAIDPQFSIALSTIDLSRIEEEKIESTIREMAEAFVWRPFSIETSPPIRGMLLRVNDLDHAFILTLHHIVFDGWSAGILLKELSDIYSAFKKGYGSPLTQTELQYADFAAWQEALLTPEVERAQLEYWRPVLSHPPVFQLATNRLRPVTQSYRGAAEELAVSSELISDLKDIARKEGATLFMLLLAGYSMLLHHASGQSEIVVGCPVANYRDRSELQGVIGPFLNTIALRVNLENDPAFRDLLGQVKRTALEAYKHQDVPFEKIVEACLGRRSVSHAPIFQVWFNHSENSGSEYALDDLTVSAVDIGDRSAKLDLMLSTQVAGNQLIAVLRYNSDLMSAMEARHLLHIFQELLTRCAAHPDSQLSDLCDQLGKPELAATGTGT
jgi:amino acid adenylation domain-containing protein